MGSRSPKVIRNIQGHIRGLAPVWGAITMVSVKYSVRNQLDPKIP